MKAIWGTCIAAAMLVMGFVAWTYTVELEDGEVLAGVIVVMDIGLFVAVGVAFAVRLSGKGKLWFRELGGHVLAWSRQMPARMVWMTGVMVAAGLVLTLYHGHSLESVSEVGGKYQLFVDKGTYVEISRQHYVESRLSVLRFTGGLGVLLLSLGSVGFTVRLRTTRERDYPA